MQRALFYEEIVNGRGEKLCRCLLCPHLCVISNGNSGVCGTRMNINGVLTSVSYGKLCSLCIDPIEKKPLYHFYPGSKILSIATAGCNLRCLNCQNWSISQSSPLMTDNYEMSPEDVVKVALRDNIPAIAFTYTEPTVFYEFMIETAKLARKSGIRTAIVSNGFINEKPLLELCEYLDAANIDLKAFDNEIYRNLSGGNLQPVLNTLSLLKRRGVWLEITNLVVPGYTDSLPKIREMCNWLSGNGFKDTPLHFSRFFTAYRLKDVAPTPVFTMKEAAKVAVEAGMRYVYLGNLQTDKFRDTTCPHCSVVLIKRAAYNITGINITASGNSSQVYGKCNFCGALIPGVWS